MIFKEIIKLNKQGYRRVVGLDEAGRGPLAGPVVASAVAYQGSLTSYEKLSFQKIRDSKKLSAKQREEWFKILTGHPNISWGVGIVSEKIIDKINILEATKLAMARAVSSLEKRTGKAADFLVVDGNFVLQPKPFLSGVRPRTNSSGSDPGLGLSSSGSAVRQAKQMAIPKADAKIFNCIAAGIIAKVTRDRLMAKTHKKYPQYGFDKHKGYGTKKHIRAINNFGLCPTHRMTFEPIKSLKIRRPKKQQK